MEHDIVDGKIGAVGSYDLEFKEGKLKFKVALNVGVSNVSEIEAKLVIDALKRAIPGQIDDAILGILEGVLKA